MHLGQMPCSQLSGHDVGRQLLARLYQQVYGEPLPAILVTERGKPYFATGNVHFSISHTDTWVFCALSENPIGIDAEPKDRKIDLKLADKILSAGEKVRFDAAEDQPATLLKLWVQKEAYAKLTGRGWGSYLYETDFDPHSPDVQEINGCFVAVLEEKNDVV